MRLLLGAFPVFLLAAGRANAQPKDDCATLKAAFPALSFTTGDPLSAFDRPCCRELGISCDNLGSTVLQVVLSGKNLSGPLPTVLSKLEKLERLELKNNNFNEAIPASWAALGTSLRTLSLSNNFLTGPIPEFFQQFTQLETLDLSGNPLGGEVPWNAVSKMVSLQTLNLENARLVGEISSSVTNLENLKTLNLGNNFLSGSIPSGLAGMNLAELVLFSNNLTGNLPADLGQTKTITRMLLNNNQLTGSIPPNLATVTILERLSLSNNSLTGIVDESFRNLNNLFVLLLDLNRFDKVPAFIEDEKFLQQRPSWKFFPQKEGGALPTPSSSPSALPTPSSSPTNLPSASPSSSLPSPIIPSPSPLANSTETSTSTSGVFQYLNLVIFCAALATGVILFFVGRHVHKSGENMYLLRMCMVLGDYTSDVILTVTTLSRAMETSDNGAFAAGCILLITITLPPILNLLLAVRLLRREWRRYPDFRIWMRSNLAWSFFATGLACLEASCLGILTSNVFQVTKPPMRKSENMDSDISRASLVTTFLEDLPQFAIGLFFAIRTASSGRKLEISQAVLIASSFVSLLYATFQRVTNLFVVRAGLKLRKAQDRSSPVKDRASPVSGHSAAESAAGRRRSRVYGPGFQESASSIGIPLIIISPPPGEVAAYPFTDFSSSSPMKGCADAGLHSAPRFAPCSEAMANQINRHPADGRHASNRGSGSLPDAQQLTSAYAIHEDDTRRFSF